MGMLTLDGIHREDGLRRHAATVGGGLTQRRCSGVGPATGRGWEGAARRRRAPGGAGSARRSTEAANRGPAAASSGWPATRSGGSAKQSDAQPARVRGSSACGFIGRGCSSLGRARPRQEAAAECSPWTTAGRWAPAGSDGPRAGRRLGRADLGRAFGLDPDR
jgi:hypothetical protein